MHLVRADMKFYSYRNIVTLLRFITILCNMPMMDGREVHPLKSIGCFIRKPITAEQLLRRIKAELE